MRASTPCSIDASGREKRNWVTPRALVMSMSANASRSAGSISPVTMTMTMRALTVRTSSLGARGSVGRGADQPGDPRDAWRLDRLDWDRAGRERHPDLHRQGAGSAVAEHHPRG